MWEEVLWSQDDLVAFHAFEFVVLPGDVVHFGKSLLEFRHAIFSDGAIAALVFFVENRQEMEFTFNCVLCRLICLGNSFGKEKTLWVTFQGFKWMGRWVLFPQLEYFQQIPSNCSAFLCTNHMLYSASQFHFQHASMHNKLFDSKSPIATVNSASSLCWAQRRQIENNIFKGFFSILRAVFCLQTLYAMSELTLLWQLDFVLPPWVVWFIVFYSTVWMHTIQNLMGYSVQYLFIDLQKW